MPMLQQKKQDDIEAVVGRRAAPILLPGGADRRQRRQMLIALALLVAALALVILKDRDFWFPSVPATPPAQAIAHPAAKTENVAKAVATPAPVVKQKATKKTPAATAVAASSGISPVVTSRAVLPPLEVEVVAGNQRRTIPAGNNSIRVDVQSGSPTASVGSRSSAPESVRLSAETEQAVTRPVRPAYPMLAKQMRVQGSVVLQALIGRDGGIQDLHVLSGPDILSSAAMEAVKQWRFKPYYQNGLAVETEAHITVNFTISTY